MHTYKIFVEQLNRAKNPEGIFKCLTVVHEKYLDSLNKENPVGQASLVVVVTEAIHILEEKFNHKETVGEATFLVSHFSNWILPEKYEQLCFSVLKESTEIETIQIILQSIEFYSDFITDGANPTLAKALEIVQNKFPSVSDTVAIIATISSHELQKRLWQLVPKSQITREDLDFLLVENWCSSLDRNVFLDIVEIIRNSKEFSTPVMLYNALEEGSNHYANDPEISKILQNIACTILGQEAGQIILTLLYYSVQYLSLTTKEEYVLGIKILEKINQGVPDIRALEIFDEKGFFDPIKEMEQHFKSIYGFSIEEIQDSSSLISPQDDFDAEFLENIIQGSLHIELYLMFKQEKKSLETTNISRKLKHTNIPVYIAANKN